MALLFADECFPFPAVTVLRGLGHDVLTTAEAGLAGIGTDDPDILAEATRLGRAVLTMNRRDYINLHNLNSAHGGIVICSRDPDTTALAGRIHDALSAASVLAGQLYRVNLPDRPPPKVP
jgi:hypothetical protein